MRHALALIALLLAAGGPAPAQEVSLQAEYRRDAVDYDESVSEFYRLKTGLLFSEKSSFNAALVRSAGAEHCDYTWFLALNDAVSGGRLMVGHYTARFGGGLVLGRRSPFNPDDLSRRVSSTERDTFSGVTSGNPQYAFYGAAVSVDTGDAELHARFDSFFSSATRFLDADGYFSGGTDAGIDTVRSSNRTAAKSEPVCLENIGFGFSAVMGGSLRVQASSLLTRMSRPQGGSLLWDRESGSPGRPGTRSVSNSELFVEYREDSLGLFFEPAVSFVDRENDDGPLRTLTGYAYLCGFTFQGPRLEGTLIRKYTAPEYYAPYGASIGEQFPERAWFFDCALPCGVFSAGTSLSSEKKLKPDSRDDALPLSVKEELFLRAQRSSIDGSQLSYRVLTVTGNGETSRKRQLNARLKFKAFDRLAAALGTVVQSRSGARTSKLVSTSLGTEFGKINATAAYCRALVSAGNSLYAVIAPPEHASIPGTMLKRSAHVIAARISASCAGARFSIRTFHLLSAGEPVRHTLDISGQASF
ncbi:MAG: hypothetical protein EPN93_05290 [Spirochaetes bacterium]|nr:MAG: hypothetical protein EPN93_05290 [Spirochaetota bacterium]